MAGKKRLSLTLTEEFTEALDQLVEEGIYSEAQVIIREALRLFFRDHRIPPFYLEAKGMSENEMRKETFLAKVYKGWRITVYEPVREFLEVEEGDILRVTIEKAEKPQESEA